MTGWHANAPGRPLSDAAYRRLRQGVLTGELSPGQRLTERRAAAALDLGLSPVRDALRRLVHDGLVQVTPRAGYRVAPLTAKSVDDLFQAWALLGPEIGRLGVSRAGPEQTKRLRGLATEVGDILRNPMGRERAARFIALADLMFDLLAVCTGNERLVEVYRSLVAEMSRVWAAILITDPMLDLATAGANWNQALESCDTDRAAAAVRDFIAVSHSAARRTLKSRPTDHGRDVVPLLR